MKPFSCLILSFTLFLSCQPESEQGAASFPQLTSTRVPIQQKELALEFKEFQLLGMTDTLYVDLNGDNSNEKVYFYEEEETRGLAIIDGAEGGKTLIKKGSAIGAGWENLNWVDYWALTKDSSTYEILIKEAEIIGERERSLPTPGIILRRNESGGGLIYFWEEEYRWIHQAD